MKDKITFWSHSSSNHKFFYNAETKQEIPIGNQESDWTRKLNQTVDDHELPLLLLPFLMVGDPADLGASW